MEAPVSELAAVDFAALNLLTAQQAIDWHSVMVPGEATLTMTGNVWQSVDLEKCHAELLLAERDLSILNKTSLSLCRDIMDRDIRIAELERRLALLPESPTPDYRGPVSSDGRPVPDRAHENFHQSVTDVLAGRIMPAARKQMTDALNAPQPAPVSPTTTTSKPLPRNAFTSFADNRLMGNVGRF